MSVSAGPTHLLLLVAALSSLVSLTPVGSGREPTKPTTTAAAALFLPAPGRVEGSVACVLSVPSSSFHHQGRVGATARAPNQTKRNQGKGRASQSHQINAAAARPRGDGRLLPGGGGRSPLRRAAIRQAHLHPGGPVQHGRPRRRCRQPLGRRRPLGLRPLPRRAPPLAGPPLGAGARAAAPGHRRRQPRRRGRPRDGLRQRAAPLRPRLAPRGGPRPLRRRRDEDGRVDQGHRPLRRDGAPGAGGAGDRRQDRGTTLVPGGERHRQVVRRHRLRPPDGDARPRPPRRSRHPAPPSHPGWVSVRPWPVHSSRKGCSEGDQAPQCQICRCNGPPIARWPPAS